MMSNKFLKPGDEVEVTSVLAEVLDDGSLQFKETLSGAEYLVFNKDTEEFDKYDWSVDPETGNLRLAKV